MSLKFSNSSRILTNENKVVLANTANGNWLRISKEVYDILNHAIENRLSIDNLKEAFDDEGDVGFINDLYVKLFNTGILVEDNTIEVLPNKTIGFEMTHRCNLKCVHCCIDADGVVSEKEDLSTEQMKSIFRKMIFWKPETILLSGGECMLRTDFTELLIYLRENYRGKIVVSTNGTLINEVNAAVLSSCANQIDMSLDGVDEESCAIVRGKGVFNKVIKSVKLFQDNGFTNITLSMAVSDKNEHLEEKFEELNKTLGTKSLVRRFSPVGRGKENKAVFSSVAEDEVHISEKYLCDDYDKPFGVTTCSAGKRELFIASNGDIYPCPSFIKEECMLGNILEIDNLYSITEDHNVKLHTCKGVDTLNPLNYEKCKNCKVNLFCWTCPGAADKYNTRQIENYCKIIQPVLYKRVWGE